MDLPVECYERIAEYLDASDRARLSMMSRAARKGCIRQKSIRAVVNDNSNMHSFAAWLIARLDYVEDLNVFIDVFQWNFVWRFKGFQLAKNLKTVRLTHSRGTIVCIASLEEVLPTCPSLGYLYIYADVLHLGTGFSRMPADSLVIDCRYVSGDPLCWTLPGVRNLSITGSVGYPYQCTGLFFSKMQFLECESALLIPVIQFFPHLETLILDSSNCSFNSFETFVAQMKLTCPLKNLRLKGGEWMVSRWIPETVEHLEFLFCTGGVGTVSLPNLKKLVCLGSKLHPSFIENVSTMKLEYFRYESYGLPVVKPKLKVTSKIIDVPFCDMKNLSAYRVKK